MSRTTPSSPPSRKPKVPPLETGDRLTREEFERRWEAMPDLKKAELIDGVVYIGSYYRGRRIDPKIPPLDNGDHLTRAEFERRWDNMPDLKKAELIDGVVFMPPPVSAEYHGVPHSRLMLWLGTYWSATPVAALADNSTLRVPPEGDSQPDAMLFVLPEHGGAARFDKDGYVQGAPELVAEVSASSASHDLHSKLNTYLRTGVREYVVWRVFDEAVDWFVLRNDRYERLAPGGDGVYRSGAFPGLWLDEAALLRGDLAAVVRVAQQGTSAPEHAEFVKRLGSVARPPA